MEGFNAQALEKQKKRGGGGGGVGRTNFGSF